jgi:hypothetical protein
MKMIKRATVSEAGAFGKTDDDRDATIAETAPPTTSKTADCRRLVAIATFVGLLSNKMWTALAPQIAGSCPYKNGWSTAWA